MKAVMAATIRHRRNLMFFSPRCSALAPSCLSSHYRSTMDERISGYAQARRHLARRKPLSAARLDPVFPQAYRDDRHSKLLLMAAAWYRLGRESVAVLSLSNLLARLAPPMIIRMHDGRGFP